MKYIAFRCEYVNRMAGQNNQADSNAELIAKLRKCIDADNGGFANPEALREVKSILLRIPADRDRAFRLTVTADSGGS